MVARRSQSMCAWTALSARETEPPDGRVSGRRRPVQTTKPNGSRPEARPDLHKLHARRTSWKPPNTTRKSCLHDSHAWRPLVWSSNDTKNKADNARTADRLRYTATPLHRYTATPLPTATPLIATSLHRYTAAAAAATATATASSSCSCYY